MKRLATFLLLFAALTPAWSLPTKKENTSIGENSREDRKAGKQYRKSVRKSGRKQMKQMKKYAKAQRKLAKRQRRGTR